MAILATQVVHAHRCRLGGLHGSPCAAVEPARPTHVSVGSNHRTPVVAWGSLASPEAVGMSQPADLPPHRRPPYSRHTKLIAGHVLVLERRHTYVRRHTRPGARRSTLDPWILWQAAQGWVLRPLCAGGSRKQRQSKETGGKCSRRSTPVLWAWLDLNQRPHLYQGSAPGPVSAGSRRRPARTTYRWRPLRTARLRWRVDQTWTKPGATGGWPGPVQSRTPPSTLVLRDQRPDGRRPVGLRGVPCSTTGECQLACQGVGRAEVGWGWDRGAGREHPRAPGPG
jgi:hypothetical protein